VGGVALLNRAPSTGDATELNSRPLNQLNLELSERFGVPVDFSSKLAGVSVVVKALERGDLARAQMATLLMQIPEPPESGEGAVSEAQLYQTILRLRASKMLKADWDSSKHPRWPAGSPDGMGGEFAPAGTANGVSSTPAQITIPAPFEVPIPAAPEMPFEILPPPLTVPNPRELPNNPYPDRPECVEEWAAAYNFLRQAVEAKKNGTGGLSGHGKNLRTMPFGTGLGSLRRQQHRCLKKRT
jgi:hypothetical protein